MRKSFTIINLIIGLSSFGSPKSGITYKENKNQWPEKVGFAADLPAGQIFIEKQGLTWVLYNYSDIKKNHDKRLQNIKEDKGATVHSHVFKVEFENARFVNFTKYKEQAEYYNYFLGNDPSHWAGNVKGYDQVYYNNIYKNIDARFYGDRGNFEYDFIVKPGGNFEQIKLNYHFTNGIELAENKLVIHTSIGDLMESIPQAYQIINGKRVQVDCSYVLSNKTQVSFKIGKNYDSNYDLIIDPIVVVASYSGTESVSFGLGVAPDNKGNMYVYSMNITKHYPITVGAVQSNFAGGYMDCAVSKFNATGTAKRFSTYIGGNDYDIIINCFIQNNEVAIFGSTRSDSFPIINTGFQTVYGGNTDYFVIKIDTSGKTLIGSTYLGGDRAEGSSSIGSATAYYPPQSSLGEMIMDQWNNCYVIGSTNSFNFPTTPGAYRMYSDSNNASDITITKLNANLTAPIWSTYYGGSFVNCPNGLRISRSGKLYCGGCTYSKDFPTTPGVVYPSYVSNQDMVVFSMDTLSGIPIASTYIGAKFTESLRFDIDLNDNVYLAGASLYPQSIIVTSGAYNVNTGFVVFYMINSSLSQINTIARFGYANSTNNVIEIDAMNVDSCGYIYFGGFGLNSLPVTQDAIKSNANVKGNMYIGVFSPSFTSLKYGSYYGGDAHTYQDHDDGGLNYFDDRGYFYHANCVQGDFPLTSNAYSAFNVRDSVGYGKNWYNNSDAFLKIDLQTFVNVSSSLGGQIKSCSPITETFVATSNLGSVTIIPGDGSPSVNTNSLVHPYNSYGTYTAFVIAGSDPNTCNMIDSVKILIKYGPSPTLSLEKNSVNCNGNTLLLDAGNAGANYLWNTGENTQVIKPKQSGLYWVKVDNDFCSATDSTKVIVDEGHNLSTPNAFTPNGDGANDSFCLLGWDFCLEEFQVMIFDRWGEKVFHSDDPNFCWNGIYKGKLLSSDVYVYSIVAKYKGDQVVKKKGNITLIR